MARVTIEDCIVNVPNRFELVILAANRARQLSRGAHSTLSLAEINGSKHAVVALREIAAGKCLPARRPGSAPSPDSKD